MKKFLLLMTIINSLIIPLAADILTNPASGTTYVGNNIGFMSDCNSYLICNWYWGDGTALLGEEDDTYSWRYHAYRNPGVYIVHLRRYSFSTPPPCGLDDYRSVTILENRSITASLPNPIQNQTIVFTANKFKTPGNITWDMGDGAVFAHQGTTISHAYSKAGNYLVRAFDWNGDLKSIPVGLSITIAAPSRTIQFSPQLPRVDQTVNIQAVQFKSHSIDWNFGDGTLPQTYSPAVSHRYANPGTFIITANEHGLNLAPVSKAITVLPENRSLMLSSSELQTEEPLTITALNFRGSQVLWDFGDRTILSGPATISHVYKRPGNFIIAARDENGASEKKIQTSVKIVGISDQVDLEIAEISLDNGKYYKVVPKNSKNIRAQLKMKMRGTGIVSGYWMVDNQPYQFFNETVYQGQIKTIFTRENPGLPVFDPGMHSITIQLTRPDTEAVIFPTLRYFVLPYENVIVPLLPRDGSIIKEDEIANFSWEEALGGSYYQIAFANNLFPLFKNDADIKWLDCPDRLIFKPDGATWNAIKRNQWTYWKIRALDSVKNIVAESGIQEMKIIVPGAEISVEKITDMDGKDIAIGNHFTLTKTDLLMIYGQITYPSEAEYLILRIYANDSLVDQLLFRDVKKDEKLGFETSIPNLEKENRVIFQVLKSSSPSVIVGYTELTLKKE